MSIKVTRLYRRGIKKLISFEPYDFGARALTCALALIISAPALSQSALESTTKPSIKSLSVGENTYRARLKGESEFDNRHDPFAKDWKEGLPPAEYEDTEFGELLYNEGSISSKLEVLRLLSKDTPSTQVFLTALSMGLDIESTLKAAVSYQPEKSRELAASAVSVLPLVPDRQAPVGLYSSYELENLERDDADKPYKVSAVVERFFEHREILRPYPDWFQGQYHFLASAAELKQLSEQTEGNSWYRSRSSADVSKRPVFVSLYEEPRRVLIDSRDRILAALAADPNAVLPVVFIFNRINERAVDNFEYPQTIGGVQRAFNERGLMLTPTPEWQVGEHHIYAPMKDVYEAFDIPAKEDFEEQAWLSLLDDAKNYAVNDTSFLVVLLPESANQRETSIWQIGHQQQFAAWDDPRTESDFPYVAAGDDADPSLRRMIRRGLIINRPDLIAALNALGVSEVPIAFYYLDDSRQRPFLKSPRALIQAAISVGVPPGVFGGDGGFSTPVCASPPCIEPQ